MTEKPESESDGDVRESLTAEAIHNELEGVIKDPSSGKEYSAVFKDPTDKEIKRLRELEEKANDEDHTDAEQEMSTLLIGELLMEPSLDPSDIGLAWKREIFAGFMRAVGAGEDHIEEAQEFVSDGGNG